MTCREPSIYGVGVLKAAWISRPDSLMPETYTRKSRKRFEKNPLPQILSILHDSKGLAFSSSFYYFNFTPSLLYNRSIDNLVFLVTIKGIMNIDRRIQRTSPLFGSRISLKSKFASRRKRDFVGEKGRFGLKLAAIGDARWRAVNIFPSYLLRKTGVPRRFINGRGWKVRKEGRLDLRLREKWKTPLEGIKERPSLCIFRGRATIFSSNFFLERYYLHGKIGHRFELVPFFFFTEHEIKYIQGEKGKRLNFNIFRF